MDPLLLLVGLASTGSIALGALYAYGQLAGPRTAVRARLDPGRDIAFHPAGVLRQQRRRIPLIDRLPVSAEGREHVQLELERAGLHWRVQEFYGMRLVFAVGFLLAASVPLSAAGFATVGIVIISLLAMLVGWTVPQQHLSRRRKKRMVTIEDQLPHALTAISKSLRAGSGLLQALAYAADETPAPLGPELGSALRDLQLGAEPVDVFEALSKRVGSADLDIAVTAIVLQRTVGGNLSEILNNVTNTIHERAVIQREVRVLVARQKLQANITSALPVGIALLFMALSPEIGGTLLNTTAGNIALGFSALCEVAGIYVVRRLAVIEV